jgi:hypothetical protein
MHKRRVPRPSRVLCGRAGLLEVVRREWRYLAHDTCNNRSMKEDSVRTTVDIPRPLYRKLKQQAAARGSSIRELVLAGVKSVLLQGQRPRSKRVRFPLIVSEGPKVNVTNQHIYEHVEFS